MNMNAGFFPAYGHRRKQVSAGFHLPLNNQLHHHAASLSSSVSARSSTESTNGVERFLPSVSSADRNNSNSHRPYRHNDFANNHLFIAKRKLARVFLGHPPLSLQATSDLLHLFDQQEPKRKKQGTDKHKRQENPVDPKATPTPDQDAHLSVVNLVMRPPLPSLQGRDQTMTSRRPRATNPSLRAPRASIESTHPPAKQPFYSISTHAFDEESEPNYGSENIDETDDSTAVSNSLNLTNQTLLSVRSIVPSAASSHPHHHLLQNR